MAELDWSSINASPEIKLLVLKLVQPSENMRLGSGKEGSQQHISKLLNDHWFLRKRANGKETLIDHANIF